MKEELVFLEQHLGTWFSRFAEIVVNATKEPFYRAIVKTADAFIGHDQDYLSFLIKEADYEHRDDRTSL